MTATELRTKVDEINNDVKVRRIKEEIEAKEAEILKIEIEIMDLKVKKINLLQKAPGYCQGFTLINDVMVNHFKLKP